MRGVLSYTQHTVAWPTLALHAAVVDEVLVSHEAIGGGVDSLGEFSFKQHNHGTSGHPWRVCAFTDGMAAMLKCEGAIRSLARRDKREIPASELLALLESIGVLPSSHHLRGIRDRQLRECGAADDIVMRRIQWWSKRDDGKHPGRWPS